MDRATAADLPGPRQVATFRSGLLLHQVEFSDGVDVPLAPNLSLTPALRYRQYTAEFDFGQFGSESGDVKYLSLDVGINLRF